MGQAASLCERGAEFAAKLPTVSAWARCRLQVAVQAVHEEKQSADLLAESVVNSRAMRVRSCSLAVGHSLLQLAALGNVTDQCGEQSPLAVAALR
jgi:nucleotide-binding universal stress UspA family protein